MNSTWYLMMSLLKLFIRIAGAIIVVVYILQGGVVEPIIALGISIMVAEFLGIAEKLGGKR